MELECSSLKIVNADGELGISLEMTDRGPQMLMFGEKSSLLAMIDQEIPRITLNTSRSEPVSSSELVISLDGPFATIVAGKCNSFPLIAITIDTLEDTVSIRTQQSVEVVHHTVSPPPPR
jgi:hypothetical protein